MVETIQAQLLSSHDQPMVQTLCGENAFAQSLQIEDVSLLFSLVLKLSVILIKDRLNKCQYNRRSSCIPF